jgi:hypothetical protein
MEQTNPNESPKTDPASDAKHKKAELLSTLNPIIEEKPSTDKIILLTSIGMACMFVYMVYTEFEMLSFLFTDKRATWNFGLIPYFFPFILLGTATALFHKRRKIGWILLCIFLMSLLTVSVVGFVMIFFWKASGLAAMDELFAPPTIMEVVLALLLFAGLIWTVCKKEIREVYTIRTSEMWWSLGLAVLLTFGSAAVFSAV